MSFMLYYGVCFSSFIISVLFFFNFKSYYKNKSTVSRSSDLKLKLHVSYKKQSKRDLKK